MAREIYEISKEKISISVKFINNTLTISSWKNTNHRSISAKYKFPDLLPVQRFKKL